jgi:acetate---CoA ligase (ADP-forming)
LAQSATPSFGPAVMVGAGGVLVESLTDRAYALVPFDAAEAGELIDSLALGALLAGRRGRRPVNIESLAQALACFSVMVADLGGLIAEIDVNPVLAAGSGTVALDALVIPAAVGKG